MISCVRNCGKSQDSPPRLQSNHQRIARQQAGEQRTCSNETEKQLSRSRSSRPVAISRKPPGFWALAEFPFTDVSRNSEFPKNRSHRPYPTPSLPSPFDSVRTFVRSVHTNPDVHQYPPC